MQSSLTCRTRLLAGLLLALALALRAGLLAGAEPPPVTLAERYDGQADVADYWVSEKYDGVRGYWTGHALITRGGTRIDAPAWFTAGWPDTPMDGELWIGYGEFARVSGIVRTHDAQDSDWRQISYRVFDLPEHGGNFDARVPAIRETVADIDQPWVVAIRQFKVDDPAALDTALEAVLARGGEGLMLHRGDALYHAGRSDDLLKLKPYEDAEAVVIAINPGQGRLEGLMGSLDVRTPDGREFAIGSGFTDAERADPPPVGSWITYRYNGETATGLPRFARFLRRRPGGPPPEPPSQP
ncbi:DNA ligase [Salinisphaera sp. S4-8]|uniref:DNA ligase n=1 Tax=Salinisphaera sp. S4-8 TaxID=633357 RepID=UPI00333E1A54